ncbi:hypothetical protein MAR_031409 [Mya arenaria]|uniref:Uncharacterized protein n=1 Tax=Mya arenaria TaxID=6604 RepID=A0ABY7F3U7_MYAAR|nr:hypothetical protein MAR_031409 [Mya arenaria]
MSKLALLHGNKQTGGGEPIEMSIKDWEEKVLATILKVSVSGIEGGGGVDTSFKFVLQNKQHALN